MGLATSIYALVTDTIPSYIEGTIEEYQGYWDKVVALKETLQAQATAHTEARELASAAVAVAAVGTAGAAKKDTSNGQGEAPATEEPNTELDKQIHRLFLRYDLDGSGTINSFNELEQLVCNLSYRLDLNLSPKQIDSIIQHVKE